LPVIHVQHASQAIRNAQRAMAAGADGVFLINHSITPTHLLTTWRAVVDALGGGAWVGLNILGVHPKVLFADLPRDLGGVWVDNALITEGAEQSDAERVRDAQKQAGWQPPQLYFGGVAFKYQTAVAWEDLASTARTAARYVDVVTTSGSATGKAASPDKLRVMKEAIGETPLAIASGITPENVEHFLPFADAFLVATGISTSFVELDEARTRALVDRVRSYAA
jgi:predicted TIM-barrel enzyme